MAAEVEILKHYIIELWFERDPTIGRKSEWALFASCEADDTYHVAKAKLAYWRRKHPERKFRCVLQTTKITKQVKEW